jgi:hypothetical protein
LLARTFRSCVRRRNRADQIGNNLIFATGVCDPPRHCSRAFQHPRKGDVTVEA